VTRQSFFEVMLEHKNDPRALFLVEIAREDDEKWRAAELGYAPAQAELAELLSNTGDRETAFLWAQQSAAQGDRSGLYQLGNCCLYGYGCARSLATAIALFKQSAELGFSAAQHYYGKVAFGDCDWQRFYWTGLAARRGFGPLFYDDVLFWLPWFEKGEMGRVLHTAAPVLGECLDEARATVFGVPVEEGKLVQIRRVVLLYEAMMAAPNVRLHAGVWRGGGAGW
jgi:TPR repeat protein